ncbi:uncharacterized protein LOC132935043 isoform X5 [Metopolophium dirhodum]|uniref:uncharacterized protein LOC132935043 isoform X5 n=1 Tax=Metopolophium dirhodum TaxID=44670 RepID=UPI00299024F3|nr:uncharacterized protein LOC132935043 isoform X5 [Metopolophium dirhodum]
MRLRAYYIIFTTIIVGPINSWQGIYSNKNVHQFSGNNRENIVQFIRLLSNGIAVVEEVRNRVARDILALYYEITTTFYLYDNARPVTPHSRSSLVHISMEAETTTERVPPSRHNET